MRNKKKEEIVIHPIKLTQIYRQHPNLISKGWEWVKINVFFSYNKKETSIFDKVYFFSLKLSAGFASLFTIERINLKSRSGGNFII